MTHRGTWLVALLALAGSVLGAPAAQAGTAQAGVAQAGVAQLRDCGTKVERQVGTGWCQGTGSFQVAVACADGTATLGGRIIIRDGRGYSISSCPSGAVSARIVQLS